MGRMEHLVFGFIAGFLVAVIMVVLWLQWLQICVWIDLPILGRIQQCGSVWNWMVHAR